MRAPSTRGIFASARSNSTSFPAAVIDRRSFLISAGLLGVRVIAGGRLLAPAMSPVPGVEQVGLQLYSVRRMMSRDLPGTLREVAAIGYRNVEFAGYFDRGAAELRRLLATLELAAPSAHVPYPLPRPAWEGALRMAVAMEHEYVVVPWIPAEARRTVDDWKRVAALLNEAGREASRAGLRLAYHNHAFEFEPVGGMVPYDILLSETDPEAVAFQLDLYWMVRGGHDPMHYLAGHGARFPTMHVKDSAGPPEHRMVDVGEGRIDFPHILARASEFGTRYYFAEHDDPADPMMFARRSFAYLAALPSRPAPR